MPIYNRLPIIGEFLKLDYLKNAFSPAEQKMLFQKFRNYIGLGEDVDYKPGAFEEMAEMGPEDFEGFFKGTKDPKDAKAPPSLTDQEKYVKEKLSANTTDAQIVKAAIATALKKTDAFKTAKTTYTNHVGTFNELVKGIPKDYKAQDLISVWSEYKTNAVRAIEAQHTEEKRKLEFELDNNPNVSNSLKATFGGSEAEAKRTLMEDLDKAHKQQLDFFKKETAKVESQLHQASAKELDRILFLAHLHKNNPDARAQIEAEINKLRAKANPGVGAQAVVGMDDTAFYLSQVDLASLKTIKALTGSTMTRQDDGSYKIEMSRYFRGALYYNDPRQNTTADMVSLAQAVRASGYDKIKMSLKFSDPDIAEKRAQEAFEGCIKAGFKLADITIEVNGKPVKGSEIGKEFFKNDQGKYTDLINQSNIITAEHEKNRQDLKRLLESPSTNGTARVKEELAKIIARNAPPAAPPAVPAAVPAPSSGTSLSS